MSENQYTPAQLAQLGEKCVYCAAEAPTRKDERGNYVHFKEGLRCDADKLRKLFDPPEKPLEQQAWESFMSAECPNCKTVKKPRQSFCLACYKALPRGVQQGLWKKFKKGYVTVWIQACAMLKQHQREMSA